MAFNFFDEYMDYSREWESPDQFWLWSAISCLSAVIRDNLYINIKGQPIYANMYVVLFADSGDCRKGAPCKLAGSLVEATQNTKYLKGDASIQAVVKVLGDAWTTNNGTMVKGASGLIFAEELSAFFAEDPRLVDMLTTLYDFHPTYTARRISSGDTDLKNVCLSLLAGSNSELFSSIYNRKGVLGGLLGRTFIVKGEKPRQRTSLFRLEEIERDRTYLEQHLLRVSALKGPISISSDARAVYDSWYSNLPPSQDKIGFESRLGTHVAKIAIAVAAAREDFDLILLEEDIDRAIDLCMELRPNYRHLTLSSGGERDKQKAAGVILQMIVSSDKYMVEKRKVVQRFAGDLDIEELDKIIDVLIAAEWIEPSQSGANLVYRLTDLGKEKFID